MRVACLLRVQALLATSGVALLGCGDSGGSDGPTTNPTITLTSPTTSATETETETTGPTSSSTTTSTTGTGSSESGSGTTAGLGDQIVINGEAGGDNAGLAVSAAGDVNGDGVDDVLIGAPLADPGGMDGGRAYVVFGSPAMGTIELADVVAGTGGFAINGAVPGDNAGSAVAAIGDVNGDSMADIAVGAPSATVNGASGRAYVIFGTADTEAVKLSEVAAGMGGFAINGEADGDKAGAALGGAGDVNGDGVDDILVGAYAADPISNSDHGRTYVVFGKTSGTAVELSDIVAGNGGYVINGENGFDRSGYSCAGAGDVNGDGTPDLITGAPFADPAGNNSGRAYVVFGKTSDTNPIELSAVALGTGGFAANGIAAGDFAGVVVDGGFDVNDDGLDDVIVGAPIANPNGSSSGSAYLIFGKADTTMVELSDIGAGAGGFGVNGEAQGDLAGTAVGAGGDLDGDGLDEVLVGAIGVDLPDSYTGRAYVIRGTANTSAKELSEVAMGMGGFSFDGELEQDRLGNAIASGGDFDGDGMDDVIIGVYRADVNGTDSGRAYILLNEFR